MVFNGQDTFRGYVPYLEFLTIRYFYNFGIGINILKIAFKE